MFQTKDLAQGYIRYAGRSRAVVIDNNDPLKRGRIRVLSPVLGETTWLPYLTAAGMFSVPDIDDVVYIECDGGDWSHPVAWGNLNYGADNDLQFPEVFQRVSPSNRGFYSPGGHLLEIDDGTDPLGSGSGIRFTGSNGASILMDTFADSITFTALFGDTLSISAADGIQASTPSGTSLSMKNGSVDVSALDSMSFVAQTGSLGITAPAGPISINAGAGDLTGTGLTVTMIGGGATLKLANGQVGLGGPAGELLAEVSKLADEVSKLALEDSTHVHPTAVGPSGPPTNAANMVAINVAATAIKTIIDLIKGGI